MRRVTGKGHSGMIAFLGWFGVRILSVHRYPRYVCDIYIRAVLQRIWRLRGMQLGKGINWLGVPIVSLAPDSLIRVGKSCVICSRSTQTALGVNHPVILRTLRPGARLIVGEGVRMSGTT